MVENHGQKKKELDGQDGVVERSELKSAFRAAKDEIEKSADQQKNDGDP